MTGNTFRHDCPHLTLEPAKFAHHNEREGTMKKKGKPRRRCEVSKRLLDEGGFAVDFRFFIPKKARPINHTQEVDRDLFVFELPPLPGIAVLKDGRRARILEWIIFNIALPENFEETLMYEPTSEFVPIPIEEAYERRGMMLH